MKDKGCQFLIDAKNEGNTDAESFIKEFCN